MLNLRLCLAVCLLAAFSASSSAQQTTNLQGHALPQGSGVPSPGRPIPQLSGRVEPSLSNPNAIPRMDAYAHPDGPVLSAQNLNRPAAGTSYFPSPAESFGPPTRPTAGAVDPITGLPLQLLAGPNPYSYNLPLPSPQSSVQPQFVPAPPLPGPNIALPSPGVPTSQWSAESQLIQSPLSQSYPQAGSPIVFDGRVESGPPDQLAELDLEWGSLDAPIPQIDPPLPAFGNNDGTLDLYDIIEEYTGRATHSGIPDEPHLTHPDQRSWLRIEDWRAEATWLAGKGNFLGIAAARGSVGIGLAKIKGVVLRPTFASYWLSGPGQTDLPSQVYDAELEATWMHRFNDRFRMHVSARGGAYSDFDTSDDIEESLRVSGTGIGAFEINPDLQLVAGVAYFNLGNVWAWPVAGVVWQPSDELRFELLFPEARISALVNETEFFSERAYIGAKFFGRTWQVNRAVGMRERATYTDWRFMAGHEIHYIYGISTFIEIGYAFNRELEYRSGMGDYEPEGVAFISGGLYY